MPGLEFLTDILECLPKNWDIVDYVKVIGVSLMGIAATYSIVQARRREIADERKRRYRDPAAEASHGVTG